MICKLKQQPKLGVVGNLLLCRPVSLQCSEHCLRLVTDLHSEGCRNPFRCSGGSCMRFHKDGITMALGFLTFVFAQLSLLNCRHWILIHTIVLFDLLQSARYMKGYLYLHLQRSIEAIQTCPAKLCKTPRLTVCFSRCFIFLTVSLTFKFLRMLATNRKLVIFSACDLLHH